MDEKLSNNPHRAQIISNLRAKETVELVAIWQDNDLEEWSPETMSIIGEILSERLGYVPEQDPWEGMSVEFPDEKKLRRIADSAIIFGIIIFGLAALEAAVTLTDFFINYLNGTWRHITRSDLVLYLWTILDKLIYSGFGYLVLRGIGEIIYLLIDIRAMIKSGETNGPETGSKLNPVEFKR